MDQTILNDKDLILRKTVGRSYLSTNQLAEAIETYTAIIHDYPMDVEAYLVLGDLYLAGEDAAAALSLYLKARLISPENPDITSRIELAESEQPDFSKVINPLGEERRNNLLERLTGKTRGVQEQEIEKATKLLEEIIHSSNPADLVATHLDQIDSLLPALLELNIRQARMENRGDLVEGLAGIQEAIEQGGQPVASISFPKQEPMPGDEIENITLLVPNQDEPSVRAQFIQDCLMAMGKQVELAGTTDAARAVNPQMVIACNPHANPWLLEYMAECTAHKVPIILDLDADYEQMPLNHPDYIQKGLGFPTNARAYTAAFLLSNLVTTPSERFSEQLERTGYHSRPIPDGWSRTNYLWEKAAPRRSTINIGWIGGSGMLDDVAEIRRILIRVIREFSRAQLVVAEDLKAFQLFENLPENRKLFLPEVSPDDYPYILGQLDILVVPLRNVPFNFTLPDTILMQAGIKKIPWVASRNPMTVGWSAGGLLATTPEEWHTNLRQLVIEEDARIHLGEAGYEKARLRELESMKKYWMEAIQLAARDPLDRGFLSRKANIEAERDSR